jgi:hypothetical protein
MVNGVVLAIGLSYYAFKDAQLSWRNLNILKLSRTTSSPNLENGCAGLQPTRMAN